MLNQMSQIFSDCRIGKLRTIKLLVVAYDPISLVNCPHVLGCTLTILLIARLQKYSQVSSTARTQFNG